MEKQILIEALKRVKEFLNGEELILTGSSALIAFGFTKAPKSANQDIDIAIVNPKPETIELLRKAVKLNPALIKPLEAYDDPESSLIAILSLVIEGKTVKIDVFKESEFYKISDLTFEGYKVSSVQSIIVAKRSYNRLNDIHDLNHYALQFIAPNYF